MYSFNLDYKCPSRDGHLHEEQKLRYYVTLEEAILMYLIQCHARMLLILTLYIHNIHFYIFQRDQFANLGNKVENKIWAKFIDEKQTNKQTTKKH